MKKIINYIIKKFRSIAITFLLSIFFVFVVFPALANNTLLKNLLKATSKEIFIGITALVLTFLVYSWGEAVALWERYKNTIKLEPRPFVYLDGIFLFIAFSILLILLFQRKALPVLSLDFKVFLSSNSILIVIWFLSSYFWRTRTAKENIAQRDIDDALSDEPIQFEHQDLLNRNKFVEDFYEEIISLPFPDSFVFGLYGSWGEGKTSVINLLKSKFKSKKNDKFLIVDFDPWYFKDEKAILSAFYRNVERTISKKFILPDLKKTFLKYKNLISLGLSQVGIKFILPFREEAIEEIKQRIESYITQIGKKIVIFIDDIDRLQPNDILLIFKLVRLNAKFKNTIFILSFDPIIIQEHLTERFKIPPEFLEKIVQKPVHLPAIEQEDIDNFFKFHLNKFFNEIEIPEESRVGFYGEFLYIYQDQIWKLFKTLRDVKRYLNGLLSTLPPIKNEVYLYDFLILEVIRVFYLRVYNDIWRNFWFYIPLWGVGSSISQFIRSLERDDEKYTRIKEHIENIIKDEEEKDVLKELLITIFFVRVKNALTDTGMVHDNMQEIYREKQRITHPECFKKYFMLQVSPRELSDEFIEATLDIWDSGEKELRENIIEETFFKLQKENKLFELLEKLRLFRDKIKKDIVTDIIKTIYKNADKFSKKGKEGLWDSEYFTALLLLLWLVNDRIDKDKIQEILEEIVAETPSFSFAVHVIHFCNKGRTGALSNIYDSIEFDNLKDKVVSHLNKYFIENKRDIFEELEESDWGVILYYWATDWETFDKSNKKVVNDYIFSLFKGNPQEFVSFLEHKRTPRGIVGEPAFDLDNLGKVYNLEKFYKLSKQFIDDETLSEDEKEMVKTFMKSYERKRR